MYAIRCVTPNAGSNRVSYVARPGVYQSNGWTDGAENARHFETMTELLHFVRHGRFAGEFSATPGIEGVRGWYEIVKLTPRPVAVVYDVEVVG